MHICGTCKHLHVEEENLFGGGNVEHYVCSLKPGEMCGYCHTPCDKYEADQEYIDFMGFTEDE